MTSPLPRILQGDPYTVKGTDRITVAQSRVECQACKGAGDVPDLVMPNTWLECGECEGRGYFKMEEL